MKICAEKSWKNRIKFRNFALKLKNLRQQTRILLKLTGFGV